MGRTCPDQIGRKLKGEIFNSKDKTDSKVIKINTELLGYIPNTLVENLVIFLTRESFRSILSN